MNVDTSSLKVVIKAFELITQANTMMRNQRYIHFIELHKMMLIARKIYQNIIRCDMKFEVNLSKKTKKTFVKDFFDDDFVKSFLRHDVATAKDFHNNVFVENYFQKNLENNNFMIDVLIVAANSNIDENLNFSTISFRFQLSLSKKTTNRKFKINKFDNFFRLFNVHVDLHLTNNVREYETIMNVNVFAKKMKHMFSTFFFLLVLFFDVINRSFKAMIDNVVSSNFMKYLIAKNVMTQSMRFELIDA